MTFNRSKNADAFFSYFGSDDPQQIEEPFGFFSCFGSASLSKHKP